MAPALFSLRTAQISEITLRNCGDVIDGTSSTVLLCDRSNPVKPHQVANDARITQIETLRNRTKPHRTSATSSLSALQTAMMTHHLPLLLMLAFHQADWPFSTTRHWGKHHQQCEASYDKMHKAENILPMLAFSLIQLLPSRNSGMPVQVQHQKSPIPWVADRLSYMCRHR